jgi:oligoendopeptidase F
VWNLADIFPSSAEFDEAIESLESAADALAQHQDTLGRSEAGLLDFLRARDEVLALTARITSFAMLNFSEDGSDPNNQALMARAQSAAHLVQTTLTTLFNTYLSLPEDDLRSYAESNGPLAEYRQYLLELLEVKAHKLASEAESALAAVAETLNAPSNLYRNATGADLRCGTVLDEEGNEFLVTPFSVMVRAETSYDGAFRQRAYDALTNGLKTYHNTLGVALTTEIKKNVALAKLRGYTSTAEMLLHESDVSGFPSDNVPVSFFERVPGIILKELAPHMQRYARLRANVWGVQKIHFCDVKAPAVDTSSEKIPFSEVEKIIPAAVSVMGEEYRAITERAFQEKWIYRGDNIGALQGAYCNPVPAVHPYVFDPYHGILYDLFTLIHELGHAAHGVFMSNQVQQNRMSSRLFVEAPSTFNEHLLGRYLRETGSPETRLQTACAQLFTFHHNFVTHLIEGELLRRLYLLADSGAAVTTAVLDKTQLEILQEFWGDTVEFDDGAALTWMRQAHYYSGLYPYTYSVGLTASTALAVRLEQGEDVTKTWVQVLQAGGSKHALELFRDAGIDLDSEIPYREAVAYVGRLIDELEAGLL